MFFTPLRGGERVLYSETARMNKNFEKERQKNVDKSAATLDYRDREVNVDCALKSPLWCCSPVGLLRDRRSGRCGVFYVECKHVISSVENKGHLGRGAPAFCVQVRFMRIPALFVCASVAHAPVLEESVPQLCGDAGGSDEDPLPTEAPARALGCNGRRYSGVLYRSTTARPVVFDIGAWYSQTEPDASDYSRLVSRRAGYLLQAQRIWALIRRYLFIKVRDLHRVANLFYFPLLDVLMAGIIWVWRDAGSPEATQANAAYLLSTIFWIVTSAAQFEMCFNFLEELQSRNLINLFTSMLGHGEWLAASAVLSVIEALLNVGICELAAHGGFGISIGMIGWQLPFFLAIFVASGWAMAVITAALFFRYGQRATFLIWAVPYIIMPFTSPFYPLSTLPWCLRWIGYCLPPTYLFEAVRGIVAGHDTPSWYPLASLGLTTLYVVLAVAFFNYMFAQSMDLGLARVEQD